jgi:hypothetical protein
MRKAEELAGIANAQTEPVDEQTRSRDGRPLGILPPTLCAPARHAAAPDRLPSLAREPDLFHQFCGICILDPQTERFANAPPNLVECLAIGVATTKASDMRDPSTAFVSLDDNAIRVTAHEASPFRGTVLGLARLREAFPAGDPRRGGQEQSSGSGHNGCARESRAAE